MTTPEPGVITAESGVITAESRVITVEPGVITLEPGVITVESGVITFESGVITFEPGVITLEPGVITFESGVITLESGVITAESGVITAESGVITAESGVITAESGVITVEILGIAPVLIIPLPTFTFPLQFSFVRSPELNKWGRMKWVFNSAMQTSIRFFKLLFITGALAIGWLMPASHAALPKPPKPANLVVNPGFEQLQSNKKPVGYDLTGNASIVYGGITNSPGANEAASNAVALESGKGAGDAGSRDASVAQDVMVNATEARWYRFSFRGLPQANYSADSLKMKVGFFDKDSSLDGLVKDLMPDIEKDRLDIASNGLGKQGGAAVWRNYILEFKLPFASINKLKLSVNSTGGTGEGEQTAFWVDDFSLVVLPNPPDSKTTAKANQAPPPDEKLLIPMGGRWYYLPNKGEIKPSEINASNANRLYYKAGRWETPFAENMTATLKAGFLDKSGKLVDEDQEVPDNVTLRFDTSAMIVHAKNLPNHPTAKFPGYMHNPNYIKELDFTYYLPFDPKPNPNAVAMDDKNTNRALNMGSVGIATNGVVFYNPFDAGMTEAVDIMDRCCGHPSPDSRYHYHKYPVCVRSPFQDEGKEHSPVIGFAFDGLPVYGPYESDGEMAKDSKGNPLNNFNAHFDAERGWHYHVTPGKFPYIIGGYFATVDSRNVDKRGGRPPGGGPPGGGFGPPGQGGPPPPGGGRGGRPFPPPGFPPPPGGGGGPGGRPPF